MAGFVQGSWDETGVFSPNYEIRVHHMADLISNECKSILDLGCGEMTLKKYIRSDVCYVPCDYVIRSEDTIVCNLDSDEFPKVYTDVAFASGLIGHIVNYKKLIDNMCLHAEKEIITSYAPIDYAADYYWRYKHGAKNHLSIMDFTELFVQNEFTLVYSTFLPYTASSIFKFVKNE